MYKLLNDRRAEGIGTVELLYDANALVPEPILRVTLDHTGAEIVQAVPSEKATDAFIHPFAYIHRRLDLELAA